jgi:hypothetical protein
VVCVKKDIELYGLSTIFSELQKNVEQIQQENRAQFFALQKSMGLANHMMQSVASTDLNSAYTVHLNSINQPLESIQNIINTMNSSKIIYELNSFIEKAANTTFISDIISDKITYSSLISNMIGDKTDYASVISNMIGDKTDYASVISDMIGDKADYASVISNMIGDKADYASVISNMIGDKTDYASVISDMIGDKADYASVISDMIGDKADYASLFSNLLTEISKSTKLYQNTFETIQGIGLHQLPLEEFRKFVDNDLNDFKQKQTQTPIKQQPIRENKHPRKRLITKTRKLIQNKEIQGKVSFYAAIYSFLCQLDPCTNSFSEYSKYIYLAIISLIVWFAEQKNYCDKN